VNDSTGGATASTDAIAVVAEEHERIRATFSEFEGLPPSAHVRRSKVVARMIDLVTVHAYLGEQVLYPRLIAAAPELESAVSHALSERRTATVIAAELWTMRPEDERFSPHATALISRLREHLHNEEGWLPRLASALGADALHQLGADLVRARRRAPASPRVDD